jgi:hypothetical protein
MAVLLKAWATEKVSTLRLSSRGSEVLTEEVPRAELAVVPGIIMLIRE